MTPKPPTPQGISAPEPPVRCALCLRSMNRWYYSCRAPICARCWGKEGPVQNPWLWELTAAHVSPAARDVWESWAELIVTAGKPGTSPTETGEE